MRADDRALADLAASVADGQAVDWQAAQSRAPRRDLRLIHHLRLVESIATLYRSLPEAEPPAEEEPRADAEAGAEPSGPRWGRLVMLDRIGEGTSCEVYRAWDTELHRHVALKLLHDESTARHDAAHARLLEEARRLARLRHPHVVQVYGAEQHDGRVGLWMELVQGESLEQVLKARGPFGAREAASTGLDVCASLAAVHAAGLLHRDVKAQNVMRETGGRLVLMDFGTGEELRRDAGSTRMVGTPLYLAPEIFEGRSASVASDLYSVGVLLFYLATGEFPVKAATMEQLADAHADRQRRRLRDLRPDLPEAFVRVVECALHAEPARRYSSAGEMEAALREALEGRAVDAPVPVVEPARRWQFTPAFLAAAAILLAVISGLIVWSGRAPAGGAPAITSLAVLPLVAQSGSSSAELTDAMTEQLIATVGQIEALRTTSLMSTLPFKGDTRPPTEIARLLGVDAVLKGVLNVDGGARAGRVRLDTTLIKAGTGATLWTGSFEGQRGGLTALFGTATRALARAVNAKLVDVVEPPQRSTSPAAEDAYFQGRLQLAAYGPEPARRALASFQRALTLDPTYGAAHAGAALAHVRLGDAGVVSLAEARLAAMGHIRDAFESGDDSADVHAALAETKFLYDWDWDGAEREYRRSLELNAGFVYARSVYAQLLAARRRFDEALTITEETMRIDPQSSQAILNHGLVLYYKKDFTAAREVADRIMTQEPTSVAGRLLAARVAEAQSRFGESLEHVTRAVELSAGAAPNLRVMVVRAEALAGHAEEAAAAAATLEAAAANGTIRLRHRDRAYMELGLGRIDRAIQAFAAALEERDPALVWITVDPRVDGLRSDARFQTIIRTLQIH